MKSLLKFAGLSAVLASTSWAQISLTVGNLSYSQNFDTLTRSTTAEEWVNNTAAISANDSPQLVGLPGWYVGSFGNTATTPQIRAGTGSGTTGSFYSFGSTGNSDRALGTLPTDSTASGSMRIGVRFVNNTGHTIDSFTFSYTGEQWREASLANATNNQFVVAYAIFDANTGSLDSAAYSDNLPNSSFNTPVDGGDSSASALDGNDSAYRVTNLGTSISSISLLPGQELWLRWFDSNSSSADHGIAIDDFTISFSASAVPEPSAFAALAGLGALGFVSLRRRRRA